MKFGFPRIYTVHIKPGQSITCQQPVFVKEGFNWLAFLLAFLWALSERLWLHALAILSFNALLYYAMTQQWLSEDGIGIIQLGVNALIGFQANDWVRGRLNRQGYIMADIITGDTLARAQQRYFERALAAQPS